jgi:hypothetical protein
MKWKSWDFAPLQVQNQIKMTEQAAAPVIGHRRPSRLLLVIDAGQFIVVRDDRKSVSHTVIVETTTREFPCMYVCSVARRRPPKPVTYRYNLG